MKSELLLYIYTVRFLNRLHVCRMFYDQKTYNISLTTKINVKAIEKYQGLYYTSSIIAFYSHPTNVSIFINEPVVHAKCVKQILIAFQTIICDYVAHLSSIHTTIQHQHIL